MKFFTLALLASTAFAAPIPREVPQEHSHERFLTAVGQSLNLDNPDQIVDPVFGLLGNAAATQGLGNIQDPDCLQLATADRAFTNAKAAGDVDGQVSALIYRTLERNTGSVGLASVDCTSIQAVNPEIAVLQQHQDPASSNAQTINKGIVLELARQIASVGGDPLDAILSGTFAPGDPNDPTAKGNSCDDANDPVGCIYTLNLLVPDATEAEIQAAVMGTSAPAPQQSGNAPPQPVGNATSSMSAGNAPPQPSVSAGAGADTNTSGQNLQGFTGALGGVQAPSVINGGRGFAVAGSESFLTLGAALGRSCDIQHNACANAANSGQVQGLTVGQCDQQNDACRSQIN